VLLIHVTVAVLTVEFEIFIKWFILFFWVLCSWWIPFLITLGIWRHMVRRYPLSYTPDMWAMAFPVAMYTVGTIHLSIVLEMEFLMIIPYITIFGAAGVWLFVLAGMAVHLGKRHIAYFKNRVGSDHANKKHIS